MSARQKESAMPDKRLYVIEMGQNSGRMFPKDAVIAEVGRHIRFNAAVLDTFDVKGFGPQHYDTLVLCAAIEFADRRWKRPLGWGRILDVTVPVIDLKTWQKPEVVRSLHGVLNHLTGDIWRFTFVQAKNLSPIGTRQMPLDFDKTKTFAVAYSDGLDFGPYRHSAGTRKRRFVFASPVIAIAEKIATIISRKFRSRLRGTAATRAASALADFSLQQ